MALYEYRCPNGHVMEVRHPMGETPTFTCEVCNLTAVRVLGAPMIHTQYYFSPQVRGARRPRHLPSPDSPP